MVGVFVTRGGGGGKSSVSHSAEFKDGKRLEGPGGGRTGVARALDGRGTVWSLRKPCTSSSSFVPCSDIDCIGSDNELLKEVSSCVLKLHHILQDSLNCDNMVARSL